MGPASTRRLSGPLSTRQNTRLNDEAVVSIPVKRCFHQSEIEVQTAAALDEVDDLLGPLLDAVADDQEQEIASSQVARDVVDELRLDDIGVALRNQFV